MPRVISYTPAWLSRSAPGYEVFSSSTKPSLSEISNGNISKASVNASVNTSSSNSHLIARRILARRGTEIFVVVGNTIRWSDLSTLKNVWELRDKNTEDVQDSPKGKGRNRGSHDAGDEDLNTRHYRTLKVPVSQQIRQLIPSPNGDLLAILTSHTVHIAILPDPSHLGQPDTGPIRLKAYTLGPTTHVLSQSPVVSALWHPLGVAGECLVTVTAEAVVRLWEVNRDDRWSFDAPKLTIDLKKLANGKSAEDDFSAATMKSNRGFSLDGLGMEVAAACFGGNGSNAESGWPSMTLWIAMKEGDVYALCPLLPSKWQCWDSIISVLTTSTVAKAGFMQDEMCTVEEQRQCDEQYQWMMEIDKQESMPVTGRDELICGASVYERPMYPGPIPKLQGPFQILPDEPEEDLELSDIHVIAAKVDPEELLYGEEEDLRSQTIDQPGLSRSVVCLLTRSGRVLICLDLDGVEAQWLPSRKLRAKLTYELAQQPELILIEAVDTLKQEDASNTEYPAFSQDVQSSYSFLVTHSNGVFFISLDPWLPSLEKELQNPGTEGAIFRMGVLANELKCLREWILRPEFGVERTDIESYAACIIFQNMDLGYFLLTVVGEQPQVAVLDLPSNITINEVTSPSADDVELNLLTIGPTRSAYHPPESLWAKSSLSTLVDTYVQPRHRKALKEEVRLSAATLDLVTQAHRILSRETHQLGIAAADLFRRCQRMQEELRDQIQRANAVAERIENLNGDYADDYGEKEKVQGSERIEERFKNARTKQEDLVKRYEVVRRKLARAGGRTLSEKERAWVREVEGLGKAALDPASGSEDSSDDEDEHKHEPWRRYRAARNLANELVAHSQDVSDSNRGEYTNGSEFKVPRDIRKAKMAQVMGLLERETALVDVTEARLQRLSLVSLQ